MYRVYYGESGAQGAEIGKGSTIASAKQDALRTTNVDLDPSEHIQTFAQLVQGLADTDFVVLVVRDET
jgi:hypothetical protein